MADNIDHYILSLVGFYGFKKVHSRLLEIMKDNYEYLHSQFQNEATATPVAVAPVAVVATEVSVPPAVGVAPEVAKAVEKPLKKVRKPRVKKNTQTAETIVPQILPENSFVALDQPAPEIKEVILVPPQDRRDPKEWKEYQKKAEEAKHKENETFGIQLHTILTKENLKKWVEEEGQSYAWVAREKAGCPDTQVAATAQMMGIRSKVTKKRGMILAGK